MLCASTLLLQLLQKRWTAARLEWLKVLHPVLHPDQASFMKKQKHLVLAMSFFSLEAQPHIFFFFKVILHPDRYQINLTGMTAKEEISDWIASCAENGIPHPCKQCCLQKKFYYSDSMVDKLLGYSLSPLLLSIMMAPKWATLKLTVLPLIFFRNSRKSEFSLLELQSLWQLKGWQSSEPCSLPTPLTCANRSWQCSSGLRVKPSFLHN